MNPRAKQKNTLICAFVSTECLICECGASLLNEDLLRIHLESNHGRKVLKLEPKITEVYENVKEEPDDEESSGSTRVEYETIVTARHWLYQEHNYDNNRIDIEPEFYCDICGKSFKMLRAVLLHQRMHSERARVTRPGGQRKQWTGKGSKGKFPCDTCGKILTTKPSFERHLLIHTGEKPFNCQYCEKKFADKIYLVYHERTHTGERPNKCKLCPKAFISPAALLRHNKVHTGAKPYQCPQCLKCFSQSNTMKLHILTVHLKRPWPYGGKARANKTGSTSRKPKPIPVYKLEVEQEVEEEAVDDAMEEYYRAENWR